MFKKLLKGWGLGLSTAMLPPGALEADAEALADRTEDGVDPPEEAGVEAAPPPPGEEPAGLLAGGA